MTYTPANDNEPRPIWFDQLLAKYDRLIKKKCRYDEDLCQDTRLRAVERWHQYREDGNFVAWIDYLVRGLVQERTRKGKRRSARVYYINSNGRTEPNQEHHTDINLALDSLTPVESVSVQYSAMGYLCREIGAMRGASKQAAEQAARVGRAKLVAANDNRKSGKKNAAA